jgi:hypothetical protein
VVWSPPEECAFLISTRFGTGPGLSPQIVYVTSASNLEHTLRVVVESGGFEHVSSRAYLQWLVPDREAESGTRLVSSVLVEEVSGGFLSLGQPRIEPVATGFRVTLAVTHSHTLEEERLTLVTDAPGKYRVAR